MNNEINDEHYPSLQFSIIEARLFFQHSIDRFGRLDAKAGILIGINATVISIIITQRVFFDPWFWGTVSLLPFILSAIFGLLSIRITDVYYPSDPAKLEEDYIDRDLPYTEYNILMDYKAAVEKNEKMFSNKIWPLRISVYLLIVAVLILALMASITYNVIK